MFHYHPLRRCQKDGINNANTVNDSNLPINMDTQTMTFPKAGNAAYVQVAPKIPKAGPQLPIVEILTPNAANKGTPFQVNKMVQSKSNMTYTKKKRATPKIRSEETSL